MVRWSEFIHIIFYMGTLFQVAYLSEPGKRILGIWLFLAIMIVPILFLLFFQQGAASDETVARAHRMAALWYTALTLVCVWLAITDYRPPGWIVFLVCMAPGQAVCMWVIWNWLHDPESRG